jgi:hypothetical protein
MKELENNLIRYWIENGILYSEFKQKIDLNVENVKEFISLRHEISNKKNQYWCMDFENLRSFPKDAQQYTEIYGQEYISAAGVVVSSHVSKFIFNSFALSKTSVVPLQMFSDKEEAVKWLKEMQTKIGN